MFEVYVIVNTDGEVYGAYGEEDLAWYAWEEANRFNDVPYKLEPQRVPVLEAL